MTKLLRASTVDICKNLAHNLKQLRQSDNAIYTKLVESVIVGPHDITDTEVKMKKIVNICLNQWYTGQGILNFVEYTQR